MTDALAAEVARLNNIASTQDRLKVSRTQVFKLISTGQLRSVKIGNRRLIPEQAIVDFINALDAAAGGAAMGAEPITQAQRDYREDLRPPHVLDRAVGPPLPQNEAVTPS